MNSVSNERMPPLALYNNRCDSPQDPFENSFSSGVGGGGSNYISCIDFFVPVDLACGPPDDLSHATTPRVGSTNTVDFSSAKNKQKQKKKLRGLRSLLFGERPTVVGDSSRGYQPSIEYVKPSPACTDAEGNKGEKAKVAATLGMPATSTGVAAAAPSMIDNSAIAFHTGLNVSSVPSSRSSDFQDYKRGKSPTSKNSLTFSASKPRAVVDGIDCQRYNLVDREQRQEVANNLREICHRLGPRRSRRMVLPALDLLCDFEDTTLQIAQSLSDVFFACEGTTHSHLFVSLIYDLCSAPDPAVSSEAAKSVKRILLDSGEEVKDVLDHLYPVLTDMTFSPWTSVRCSAATIQPLLAKIVSSSEDKLECKSNFKFLCEDLDVTVRRSALSVLHEWLTVISASEWHKFPLGVVDGFLSEKNHDTIRIQLAEVIVELAQVVGKPLASQFLLNPTVQLAKDRSWRVRYIVSSHFGALYNCFSQQEKLLMPSMLRLASDEEVQVRVSIAKQIGTIAALASNVTVETTLVDIVHTLGKDESPEVRAGIAKSIGPVVAACAPSVGRPLIMQVLLPLLSDTSFPLVQHTAIMGLAAMAPLMADKAATDLFSLVVLQLQTASQSTAWRVRESVANLLHHFAAHVRTPDQFEELVPILIRLINDDSSAVRCAIVHGLPMTVQRLGATWSTKNITRLLDFLVDKTKSKFYQRIQACTILSGALPILERDLAASWVLVGAQNQSSSSVGSMPSSSTNRAQINSGDNKYFSTLSTETRTNFNSLVGEVISRLIMDKVLSVREAAARLVITIFEDSPSLFVAEREGWANALRADAEPTVKEIIGKSTTTSAAASAATLQISSNPF